MKVRDGYVSNSSSSSFLLIATKEAYEKAKEKVDKYTAFVATEIQKKCTKNLGDQEIILVHQLSFENGDGTCITDGIDDPKPQVTTKRGCKHDVPEDCGFCSKCGKPRMVETVEEGEDTASSAWYRFRDVLEATKKGLVIEHRDF